jgi:aerobic-type carbon monoxide dehydrogenase small subunit (CoxS/CutS family)
LREDLAYRHKHGCELAVWRRAVLADGRRPIVPDAGRRMRAHITTVEGLAADGRLHPQKSAFADLNRAVWLLHTGILITAKALLDHGRTWVRTHSEARRQPVSRDICRL